MAWWIKKQDPTICYLPETHLTCKDTHRLKVKEWKKKNSMHMEPKAWTGAILMSDKIAFKSKPKKRQTR